MYEYLTHLISFSNLSGVAKDQKPKQNCMKWFVKKRKVCDEYPRKKTCTFDDIKSFKGEKSRGKKSLRYNPFTVYFVVCVTEQHYVSTFFTCLWFIRKAILFRYE